jgi:hypothetical protein
MQKTFIYHAIISLMVCASLACATSAEAPVQSANVSQSKAEESYLHTFVELVKTARQEPLIGGDTYVSVTINGAIRRGIPCGNKEALKQITHEVLFDTCSYPWAGGDEPLKKSCFDKGLCPGSFEPISAGIFTAELFASAAANSNPGVGVRGWT